MPRDQEGPIILEAALRYLHLAVTIKGIDRLTLQYNRARQEAITTELMDIVNGVESMR